MDTSTILVGLGALLILIGIVGGGFEVKEIKIPRVSIIPRLIALLLGLFFSLSTFLLPTPEELAQPNANNETELPTETAAGTEESAKTTLLATLSTLNIDSISASQPGSWQNSRSSASPNSSDFIAGSEAGRRLPLCRAQHEGELIPGKIVIAHCNIPYQTKEIEKRRYERLVNAKGLKWLPNTEPLGSDRLFIAGFNQKRPILVCRARIDEGNHPGVLTKNNLCLIPFGSKAWEKHQFEVLVW